MVKAKSGATARTTGPIADAPNGPSPDVLEEHLLARKRFAEEAIGFVPSDWGNFEQRVTLRNSIGHALYLAWCDGRESVAKATGAA